MRKVAQKALIMACALVYMSIFIVFADSTIYLSANGVKLQRPAEPAGGRVMLEGSTDKSKIKLLVSDGESQTWYDVELNNGEFHEEIWLSKSTAYTISIMVHEYDRKYSYGPRITVENAEELNEYLIPAKHIESSDEAVVRLSGEITAGCSTDEDKARAIYGWVVRNIEFDYAKYAKHREGNYDNVYGAVNTIRTGQGVCYDYATLVAALGRAAGLKTKVAEGMLDTGELTGSHAWNEVYLTEEDRWIKVDSTLGATTGEEYFDFENIDESYAAYEYK